MLHVSPSLLTILALDESAHAELDEDNLLDQAYFNEMLDDLLCGMPDGLVDRLLYGLPEELLIWIM